MKKKWMVLPAILLVMGAFLFMACDDGNKNDPPDVDPIDWTITADGVKYTTDSTYITIKFNEDIAALRTEDVTVGGTAAKSGAPEQGADATEWKVPITVTASGNATLNIPSTNNANIRSTTRNVGVIKAVPENAIEFDVQTADGETLVGKGFFTAEQIADLNDAKPGSNLDVYFVGVSAGHIGSFMNGSWANKVDIRPTASGDYLFTITIAELKYAFGVQADEDLPTLGMNLGFNGSTAYAERIFLIPDTNTAFVAVEDITGVEDSAFEKTALDLVGLTHPFNATNYTIVWSLVNAGETGSTLSGYVLEPAAPGTVTVRATIANGRSVGQDYTQDFEITVLAFPFVEFSDADTVVLADGQDAEWRFTIWDNNENSIQDFATAKYFVLASVEGNSPYGYGGNAQFAIQVSNYTGNDSAWGYGISLSIGDWVNLAHSANDIVYFVFDLSKFTNFGLIDAETQQAFLTIVDNASALGTYQGYITDVALTPDTDAELFDGVQFNTQDGQKTGDADIEGLGWASKTIGLTPAN